MNSKDILICLRCGWEGVFCEGKNPTCAYAACPNCGYSNLRWKDYYEKNKTKFEKKT